jgi:hypothetical protein
MQSKLGRASGNVHKSGEKPWQPILLMNFTDQGIRKIKDSPKRADAFKDMAKKCGATVKDVFLDTRRVRRRLDCRGTR